MHEMNVDENKAMMDDKPGRCLASLYPLSDLTNAMIRQAYGMDTGAVDDMAEKEGERGEEVEDDDKKGEEKDKEDEDDQDEHGNKDGGLPPCASLYTYQLPRTYLSQNITGDRTKTSVNTAEAYG